MNSRSKSGKSLSKRSDASSKERQSSNPTRPATDEIEEALHHLPPELQEIILQSQDGTASLTIERLESLFAYQGPYPPPQILAEYERYFPGSAERILDWTEGQIKHRQQLERKQVDRAEKRMDTGQKLGFSIATLAIVSAVALGVFGPSTWANALLASSIALAGIGGPAVARILARRFPKISKPPDV